MVGLLAGLAVGCGSRAEPTESTAAALRPAGVRRLVPKVDRTISMHELGQIGLAYQNCVLTTDRVPKSMDDLKPFLEGGGPIADRVKSGLYVILWGTDPRNLPEGASNTVLGHVVDVEQIGGAVLMANGSVTEMTREQYLAAPKPPGKK